MAIRLTSRFVLLACVLTASSSDAQQPPPPDSALAALIAGDVFDSLRGGGRRADMLWVAGDSVTFNALGAVAAARQITLGPPRADALVCPGSTNSDGSPLREPSGFHVFIRTRADSTGRISVGAWVSCSFVYRGRRNRGFAEGMRWEAVKDAGGWRIGAPLGRWVT